MKTLVIDGIIGWDVFATDIRAEIKSAAGEDLTIEINSPGGSVTEGIAIYNAIKAYAGNKVARIVGLAASMGSYIALAADRVIAEKNAIYMVHNAGMIAMGDHKTLRKAADIIEGMSKILARAYIDKTGKTGDEIRAMMDDETWLYGEEIEAAGFADETEGGEKGDKAEAVAMSRVAVSGAVDLLKRVSIDSDVDKAAACVSMQLPRGVTNTESGVAVQQAAGPKEKKGVNKMTKEQIQAEAPEVAEALRAEGRDAEKKRVASLSAWKGQNADADKVVDEAIASGKVIDDVMAQVVSAVARGNTKQANGDNAPDVVTAAALTASGAVAGLDETDRAAQAIFGYSDEDAKKYKEKEAK